MKTSILNHYLISSRYFFPRYDTFKQKHIVNCNDAKLACFYDNSFPKGKTVVFFHGNGEIVQDYLDLFPDIFKERGVNLFLFEYRGYGESTGKPALVDILDDTEMAIKSLNIKSENLIFYGRSVGSIYAVHAASVFNNASGLILESGIADVKERIMMRIDSPKEINSTTDELEKEFSKYFNTKKKLSCFKGKSLVMHTINDGLVDVSHAKRLYEYLNEPKQLELFKSGSHNSIFLVNMKKYFDTIFDFINA